MQLQRSGKKVFNDISIDKDKRILPKGMKANVSVEAVTFYVISHSLFDKKSGTYNYAKIFPNYDVFLTSKVITVVVDVNIVKSFVLICVQITIQ